MDLNTPPSFMGVLEGDDSTQIWRNSTSLTPPTNPRTSYLPYPPPNYHHHLHHTYYPPPSNPMNPNDGLSQHPWNYHPPYYSPPPNEPPNTPKTEYPYYLPYYPLPPPNPNCYSGGSNSTPSSTPTGSMAGIEDSRTDIDRNTDEGDVEEVMGGIFIVVKKWTIEEDQRLLNALINIGIDAVVGADQKKTNFWARVAESFNEHRLQGASTCTSKTINSRWLQCFPLVNKWMGIISEVERTNQSGSNEAMILKEAHRLYLERTGKKFDLEHWYEMLKDQPKWKKICDPPKSGSSKRSNFDSEEAGDEGVGDSDRRKGRKAAKRKGKKKANNTIIELVTSHSKVFGATNTEMTQIFKNLVTVVGEKVTTAKDAIRVRDEHQQMKDQLKLRKQEWKETIYDDKIIMMNTSGMTPEDATYYESRKAAIRQKRLGHLSLNE